MKLTDYHRLAKEITALADDLKIEAVLAELVENEVIQSNEKRVRTLGLFRRDYRNEIDRVQVIEGITKVEKLKFFEKLQFSIWREGIYDSLPKGIFHELRKEKKEKTRKEIRDDKTAQTKERQAGRDFFAPVEQEFYHQRTLLEIVERTIFLGLSEDGGFSDFAEKFWDINVKGIDKEKVIKLLFFLPYTFFYKGKLDQLKAVFSVVLNAKVSFQKMYAPPLVYSPSHEVRLGDAFLAETFLLGETFYSDVLRLKIKIEGLSAKEINSYLPGQSNYRLLQILYRFFLPVEAERELTLEINYEDRKFFIDKEGEYNDLIGYTTFL